MNPRAAHAKDADARLQALLLEGLASGEPMPGTSHFRRQLKADAGKILASQSKKTRKLRH